MEQSTEATSKGQKEIKKKAVVNMSHKNLMVIPIELQQYTAVKSLLLNDNNLVLPPSEVGLFHQHLCELVLDDNQLTMLPTELASCTKLKLLSLSGNNISLIPSSINQLTSLQSLWLNRCKLLSLPDSLAELHQLEKVGLEGNSLSHIPCGLQRLTSLKWLNCSCNNIVDVGFFQSSCLHFVNLSRNRLNKIPCSLGKVATLQTLILSGNLVAGFDDDDLLLSLSHVGKIDLRDNPVSSLPPHWRGMTHISVGKIVPPQYDFDV